MTTINRTALVPYSAERMYQLVLDVARYPEFLPWCGSAAVREQSETHQIASVTIKKGVINTAFTTNNVLSEPHRIDMTLVEGPFRSLEGSWIFHELAEDACKVEMNIEFEFALGPAGSLIAPVFSQICKSLLNAFLDRAKALSTQP